MCCATRPQPRKAATRPAHLCRGRGGRGCRCYTGPRRSRFRTDPAVVAGPGLPPLRLHPGWPVAAAPAMAPQSPQAPPVLISETLSHGFRSGQANVFYH